MKTKTHISNLQKSSGLFIQLGLVLILFTVYLAFEHKTEEKGLPVIDTNPTLHEQDNYVFPDEVQVERPKAKTVLNEPKPKKQIQEFNNEFKKADDQNAIESKIVLPKSENNPSAKDPLEGYVKVEDPDLIENIPFLKIEDAPIYKGCERVKKSERKACFEKKITKHISRKFNNNLANQLGLTSGKKRIFVEFLITKTGEINITNSSAPHVRLDKEAKRVINLIPKMTPGKQRDNPVNVKYTVPIIFNVE